MKTLSIGVLAPNQFLTIDLEVNIRNDRLRFPDHTGMESRDFLRADLFSEVGHVVTQTEEVFDVAIIPFLADQFQLIDLISERTEAGDFQHVFPGDAIVEHHPARDLEVVSRLAQVVGHGIRVILAGCQSEHDRTEKQNSQKALEEAFHQIILCFC